MLQAQCKPYNYVADCYVTKSVLFCKYQRAHGLHHICIHTCIVASHLKCNVRRLVSYMGNCTLPLPNVQCHAYGTYNYTSLIAARWAPNNPFSEERFTPFITRQCYPSHFLMCFSVRVCQYFYRLRPRNENSRLANGLSRAHICTCIHYCRC